MSKYVHLLYKHSDSVYIKFVCVESYRQDLEKQQ